jgi:hypothetical protein
VKTREAQGRRHEVGPEGCVEQSCGVTYRNRMRGSSRLDKRASDGMDRQAGPRTHGLQYSRARWYDPSVGRWISEDPIPENVGGSVSDPMGTIPPIAAVTSNRSAKSGVTPWDAAPAEQIPIHIERLRLLVDALKNL